jgi:ACT domain-containing protein
MRAIVTVVGKDRVGIIADVCTWLAGNRVNVLDISQTVMQGNFTMTMLVDLEKCELPFRDVSEKLRLRGEELQLSIRMQREDIFEAMHRV